jgi:hypothetical protein
MKQSLSNKQYEEKIRTLDELIVYLNGVICQKDYSQMRNVKNKVIFILNDIGVSNATISVLNNIKVQDVTNNPLTQYPEFRKLQEINNNECKDAIVSMIKLLKNQREIYKQLLDDKTQKQVAEVQERNIELQEIAVAEQKKANLIQKRTLWLSVIATVASIIATIISLIAIIIK